MKTSSQAAESVPPGFLARLFVPFALGYFLSQHFRTVNAVLSPDLVRDTGVDAMQLGMVTGVYFLAFAAAQLPLGLLLDKFGPRRTEAALLILTAVGATLFAGADSVWQLFIGRILIGLGVSCCMVAAFKAFAMWLPIHQLPFANGCLMASGALGVLASTVPVEAALHFVDWRGVYYGLAGATILVSGLVLFMIPDKGPVIPQERNASPLHGFNKVLRSAYFWRVVPLAVAVEGGIAGFFTLWVGPWLRDVAGFDRGEVASGLFLIALAMIVGFPFFGYLASRLNKFGISILTINIFGMSASMVLCAVAWLQLTDLYLPTLVLLMFFSTSTILIFPALGAHFPQDLIGRVHTTLNFLLFLGAFATQFAIGAILRRLKLPDGVDAYPLEGYMLAAKAIIAWQVISLLWYLLSGRFIKEKKGATGKYSAAANPRNTF